MPAVLSVSGLTKSFTGQYALRDVSLDLERGEVRGLIGQNGSGKSTLIKILSGFYLPDRGTVSMNGQAVAPGSSADADNAGLRFVHQDLGLVPSLNTIDNLALGHGYEGSTRWRIHWRSEGSSARERLAALGYDIDVSRPVHTLTASQRTAIAIARALSPRRDPTSVLVLDEPTANLPADDADRLLELVRRISADGVAVLFVSHHLAEVVGVADSVSVLRDGRLVATTSATLTTPAQLVHDMLGRDLERRSAAKPRIEAAEPSLQVVALRGQLIQDLDLSLRPGEIVGIAGITGSGREELAGLLFGDAARAGTVVVLGTAVPPLRPDLAVRAGMGLVPADRHANAAFMGAGLRENLTVPNVERHVRGGRLRLSHERREVTDWLRRLHVVPALTEQPMASLSGGNQQKVILARWLRHGSSVLLLDDPTQGVDVGAKSEIYDLIEAAAAEGTSVVVISNDEDELVRLCHRVMVLRGGRPVDELTGDDLTSERIALLSGGSTGEAHDTTTPSRHMKGRSA